MSALADAVRLSVGSFSAVPVAPPGTVDRATAGRAVALAPLAVVPVGVLVGVTAWVGREMPLPAIVTGALAIGVGALGTRAFHLDGLADTVDALSASYDRERALAVARTGDVGPAGAVALVLVLLVQAGAAGAVASSSWGPAFVALAWCLSRAAATEGVQRGVPAARAEGLGRVFAESLPRWAPVVAWLLVAAVLGGLTWWNAGSSWGVIGVLVACATTRYLVAHTVRRFGGIVGDVLGASIELSLAFLLVGLAAAV